MTSSRLPGKVLADIGNIHVLDLLLHRLRGCSSVDEIVLATTTNAQDDPLASWARESNIRCHRGSENDVLKRVTEAHLLAESDIVVEITGDCPLIDPEIVDWGVETFLKNDCALVTNAWIPSFPGGFDFVVCRTADLAGVEKSQSDPAIREHVCLYMLENPLIFRPVHLVAPRHLRYPEFRVFIDEAEDLALVKEILQRLSPTMGYDFGAKEVVDLLLRDPDLPKMNADCKLKPVR